MKSKTKKAVSKRKILAVAIISVFAVVTVVNSLVLGYLLLDRQSVRRNDNSHIANLIIRASQQLNKPAVIEPQSGKVYLPDAKLVLPTPRQGTGDVVYFYSSQSSADNLKEEVNVASVQDSRAAESEILNKSQQDARILFDVVPKLQACNRGVRIGYEPDTTNKAVTTKTLNNGRMAYFYTEKGCDNPTWLEYVKQIDSY